MDLQVDDNAAKPTVIIVAHDVTSTGGQERVTHELVRNVAARWRIVVISTSLSADLRPMVKWIR